MNELDLARCRMMSQLPSLPDWTSKGMEYSTSRLKQWTSTRRFKPHYGHKYTGKETIKKDSRLKLRRLSFFSSFNGSSRAAHIRTSYPSASA